MIRRPLDPQFWGRLGHTATSPNLRLCPWPAEHGACHPHATRTNCAPCSPSSSARHALTLKPQQSFRAKPEPVPANLSATLRVADIAVPASAATLRYVASAKGTPQMLSRKLTRFIVAGAAAIAVAGGSYGIVSATSSSGSAAAG